MKLTSTQYAQALHDAVSQTNPKDHDVLMDRFVKILAQNGDLNKYEEIESEYRRVEMKAKGMKEAEVTFAREIEMNKHIIDELNKAVGAGLGRPSSIEVKTRIDESLIGGVVIRVDDTLIDASVKGQLDKLNQQLKN